MPLPASRRPGRRRVRLTRRRRILLAAGATVLGLGLLTAAALWVSALRETDTAAAEGITTGFRDAAMAARSPIRFREMAGEAGVMMRHGPGPRRRHLPEDTGSGVAWGDYDGDGDWDLYAVSFTGPFGSSPRPEGSNRLFRNDGGHFTEVTAQAGVGDPAGFGMGAVFADYDGDGRVDLFVTNVGPDRLFRNRGDGTFEEVAERAGVAGDTWSTGAAFGDYDLDGDLDLYVCSYVAYDARLALSGTALAMGPYEVPFTLNPNAFDPVSNRLFRNRGDGTFEEVARSAGVADPGGRSLAATFCDLDGDGWLDLYVNNDVSPNRLFRNLSGERTDPGEAHRFLDLSTVTGTADPRGSMGLSVAAMGAMVDAADGLPDLFITHWLAQENALYVSHRLLDALEYRDKTRRLRLGEISTDTVGWGCAAVDLDLDGLVDLAVANGSTLEDPRNPGHLVPEAMLLLWSDGRRFHDVAGAAGDAAAGRHHGRGLAAADYDGDGDVDLAVSVNRGRLMLLENRTRTPHRHLSVRLEAPAALCFGARVEVRAQGRSQVRWYGADVGYLGCHAPELVFGLGRAPGAVRVAVRWTDGRSTVLEGVAPGRLVVRPLAAAPGAEGG